MGEQASEITTGAGEAGWSADAVGLFVAALYTGNDPGTPVQITSSLAAVFYANVNTTTFLLNDESFVPTGFYSPQPVTPAAAAAMAHFRRNTPIDGDGSDSTSLEYTICIANDKGSRAVVTSSFNFDPDSKNYIRKVFNTNPQQTNDTIFGAASAYNYWLGETFESSLAQMIAPTGSQAGKTVTPTSAPTALSDYRGDGMQPFAFAYLANLGDGTSDHGDRQDEVNPSKSGYIFSQDLGDASGFNPNDNQKLFRIVAIDNRGEWDNKNIKISIKNIKAAVNPSVDAYGTFDVLVREYDDLDLSPRILESFVGCNLNPASNNFIARRVGDRYLTWNKTEKYFEEYGTFANQSRYIRVETTTEVDAATANPGCLPFGFFGPVRYTTPTNAAATAATGTIDDAYTPASVFFGVNGFSGSTGIGAYGASGNWATMNMAGWTMETSFPSLMLRASGAAGLPTARKAFYGTTARGCFPKRDNGYVEYNRRLSSALSDNYDTVAGSTEYSFIFTLDDVSGSIVSSGHNDTSSPIYISGSRAAGTSLTAINGTIDTLLNNNINSFTLPLYGGCDGFDIIEPEPFANRLITDMTEKTSYELYSVKKAIDVVRDPEVVEHNVATVPGVSDSLVTDYLLDMADERRDTLALIDIENDYKPRYELAASDATTNKSTLPNVDTAITTFRARNVNTSYGAAYYPAVQIRDRANGAALFVPATVAALGAYGLTDRVSAPWFAPAGFNRGGLSAGQAGIVATSVSKKLRAADRDDLYEINVNPIASFPQEGIVIFGQKTLLATPSALDRVNVRRLLIFLKKGISRIANTTLFQPNVQATWNNFLSRAEPFLASVKAQFGLDDYRLILDSTTTTPELIDRNILYARVLLRPTRAIEFIAIDFEIFRSGASFAD
jgi:hypothetical protein